MYVSLEPCDHYGKTPPCTGTIIESGVKEVNVAMKDPNPINSGRGIKRLKRAGIKVNVGLCEKEARTLNRKYIKYIKEGLPYVTVKLAQSLDGKIAARDGSSKWISSEKSRKYVRRIRPGFCAIMVGAGTALKDDPYLLDEKRKGYDVARVVVDSRLRLSSSSRLIKTAGKAPVIIATTELAPSGKVKKFEKIKGVEIIKRKSRSGKVPLKSLMKALAKKDIVNVLAEGGGELVGSLVDENLADEVIIFISPKIIGGSYSSVKGEGIPNIKMAKELENVSVNTSGSDLVVRGLLCSQG